MKSVKNPDETMRLLPQYGYQIRYVPHKVIEDYNTTYNVVFENQHIMTGAAKGFEYSIE
ncbi:MAG: hypothetical protein OEY22_08225 [Candidatus Bathyarchaeota archaeon]|nr:hypothetical protein [Candidatus Bathyarchaeota archaeon]MDH5788215.1 hypothetical protein [Candidatus Bathyarchaeota archaeon]